MSLPPDLEQLRYALRQTHQEPSRAAAAVARLKTHTLERAAEAETLATVATLTPDKFRQRYGYPPADATRMRQVAELLSKRL